LRFGSGRGRVGASVGGAGGRMKKLAIVALGMICATVLLATSALAGSDLTPPEVAGEVVGNVAGNVAGKVAEPGARAGALAFTGTQITVWMVAAAALLLLGVGLLVAARQRAKRARP
jgi:hypothetical protein